MADPLSPPSAAVGEFGRALRRARTDRGLSLSGLSQLVHYSRGYLSKIETGMSKPNADLARRCDDVLGTDGGLSRLVPVRRRANAAPPAAPASSGTAGSGTADPGPDDAASPALRPFDLPVAPGHFTGRRAELAAVLRFLTRPGGDALDAGRIPVVVLYGMGGVGKPNPGS